MAARNKRNLTSHSNTTRFSSQNHHFLFLIFKFTILSTKIKFKFEFFRFGKISVFVCVTFPLSFQIQWFLFCLMFTFFSSSRCIGYSLSFVFVWKFPKLYWLTEWMNESSQLPLYVCITILIFSNTHTSPMWFDKVFFLFEVGYFFHHYYSVWIPHSLSNEWMRNWRKN